MKNDAAAGARLRRKFRQTSKFAATLRSGRRAGMPRIARPILVAPQDRRELQRWVTAHSTSQQVSQRCQIILAAAAAGQPDKDIAQDLKINFKIL